MRYCSPIYVLCVSSHFQPFTKANLVLENFNKNLGFGQTPLPPFLGQKPKFFRKTILTAPLIIISSLRYHLAEGGRTGVPACHCARRDLSKNFNFLRNDLISVFLLFCIFLKKGSEKFFSFLFTISLCMVDVYCLRRDLRSSFQFSVFHFYVL